ncbi:unnamed protein product [Mycena citricolor]|uniref:Uncharacterized protein n=1 Tax=Mycena citricolor TaxID=2018698 RepID=A0AAD2JZQ2_9AGAR|nr:unnamed protein product [Mycena citricolor]
MYQPLHQGLVNTPTTPEAGRKLQELLARDAREHHCFFDDIGRKNHNAHHLVAAYDLGATGALLARIYEEESVILRPLGPQYDIFTDQTWTTRLGERQAYASYLLFFEKKIEALGVQKTIEEYVLAPAANANGAAMLSRFFSGAVHPIIHVGLGVEVGQDCVVAQGLALCAVVDADFVSILSGQPSGLPELSAVPTNGATLLSILREVYESPTLGPLPPYNPRDMLGLGFNRLTESPARGAELRRLYAGWSLDTTLTDSAFEAECQKKVDECFWQATLLTAAAGRPGRENRIDFFLMHTLTSAVSLPTLLAALPNKMHKAQLLQAHALASALWAIARGRPRINPALLMSCPDVALGQPGGEANPWLPVTLNALEHTDSHVIKTIRTLYYAAQRLGQTPVGGVPGAVDSDGKETHEGASRLDGSAFVRAAIMTSETLGWVAFGGEPGQWDRSSLGKEPLGEFYAGPSEPRFKDQWPEISRNTMYQPLRQGLVNTPNTPEAARKLQELLARDARDHHCYFDDRGFKNHNSHHLIAAYDLGATPALLEKIYEGESVPLLPLGPQHDNFTDQTWTTRLGERNAYASYLHFFEKKIEALGVQKTIEEYVLAPAANANGAAMLSRLFSGAIHPVIHVGLGVEVGQDCVVAQGLALCAVVDADFVSILSGHPSGLPELSATPTSGVTLLSVLREVYDSPTLAPLAPYNPSDVLGIGFNDLTASPARGAELRRLYAQWSLDTTLSDSAFDAECEKKVDECFWQATLLTAAAGRPGRENRVDFFLMHILTSAMALPPLLAALPNKIHKAQVLQGYAIASALWTIARGRPRVNPALLMSYADVAPAQPGGAANPWLPVTLNAYEQADSHVIKTIRALYYAAQRLGQTAAGAVPGAVDSAGKETHEGASQLDGSAFVRAAIMTSETLGWIVFGGKQGSWDRSSLGWDAAWA